MLRKLCLHDLPSYSSSLSRWSEVPTDKPGKTDILRHDIVTGDAPSVRTVPSTMSWLNYKKAMEILEICRYKY